jgi:hypothetical protein
VKADENLGWEVADDDELDQAAQRKFLVKQLERLSGGDTLWTRTLPLKIAMDRIEMRWREEQEE